MAIEHGTPPTNPSGTVTYILKEDWLDTVLTTNNTGDAGTPNVLVDSNTDGKISDDWLYVSDVKIDTNNTPYRNPAGGKLIPDKYIIQINTTLNNGGGHIDPSLLNLLHANTDSKIVNLDSNGKLDFNLLPSVASSSEGIASAGCLVQTNNYGQIDYSFISSTNTKVSDTIVRTKSDGFLNRNFFNIQRAQKVINATVSNTTDYVMTGNQNTNATKDSTVTIPSNHDDLYVFLNGALLYEGLDYIVQINGAFRFTQGLYPGDILQFIALN